MPKNILLLSLVNANLGEGQKTSRENYAYFCPKCNHHKRKLEVDFTDNPHGNNPWQCWVCNFKGRTVMALLKAVGAPEADIRKARSYVKYADFEDDAIQEERVELPNEFIPLTDSLIKKDWIYDKATQYLASRGITMGDIYKYQIGYCRAKKYRNMIVFPTFDEKGILNYFVARSFDEKSWMKYKNPPVGKNVVPNEHLINWDVPVILCEGIFDAIAIKRNAIPLLGKTIQKQLMRRLLNSNAGKIYLALDKDAQDKALNYCEMFLDQGKEVYFVDLKKKDPSELGFEAFTKLVQNTKPLNYDTLLARKLDI
jgi:DNA primase